MLNFQETLPCCQVLWHQQQLSLVEKVCCKKEWHQKLYPAPLYSRLDFVRTQSGFAVMEVELIEPSLYFNMDQLSAERFAKAFDKWVTKISTSSV